jgi:hypothetical protein
MRCCPCFRETEMRVLPASEVREEMWRYNKDIEIMRSSEEIVQKDKSLTHFSHLMAAVREKEFRGLTF